MKVINVVTLLADLDPSDTLHLLTRVREMSNRLLPREHDRLCPRRNGAEDCDWPKAVCVPDGFDDVA